MAEQLELGVTPTPMATKTTKPTEAEVEAALEAERKAIGDHDELERFLNSSPVATVFADLGKDYYAEWLGGETVTAREETWAKARALLDVAKDLRSVYARGRAAKATRRKRQARERAAEERKAR